MRGGYYHFYSSNNESFMTRYPKIPAFRSGTMKASAAASSFRRFHTFHRIDAHSVMLYRIASYDQPADETNQ